MKKTILFGAFPLIILSLAVFAAGTIQAEAATCPAGYVCTPVSTTVTPACPSGYVCSIKSSAGSGSSSYTPRSTSSYTPTTAVLPTVSSSVQTNSSCYAFQVNLSLGSTGADVTAIQSWLISNGFDIPAVSSGRTAKGYYGSQTAYALGKYQDGAGITVEDGILGPVTRAKVNLVCNSTITTPSTIAPLPTGASLDLKYSIVPTYVALPAGQQMVTYSATIKTNPVVMAGQSTSDVNYSSYVPTLAVLCPPEVIVTTSGSSGSVCGKEIKMSYVSYGSYVSGSYTFTNSSSSSVNVQAYASMSNTAQGAVDLWVPGNGNTSVCTMEYAPVCGNSVTYSNSCMARASGVTNYTSGACSTTPGTTQSSITVLSPKEGEVLKIGSTYSIQWKSNGLDSKQVEISLERKTDLESQFWNIGKINGATYDFLPSTGSFSWTVPSSVYLGGVQKELYTNGAAYRILVAQPGLSGREVVAHSGVFSLVSSNTSTFPLITSCSAYTYNTTGLNWNAQASGGKAPYTYSWSVYNDVSAYVGGSTASASFTANYSSAGTKQAVVSVTDSLGTRSQATCSGTISTTQTAAPTITRISAPAASDSEVYAGSRFAIGGTNFVMPDSVYLGDRSLTVTQDGNWQTGGVLYALVPSDIKSGSSYVYVKNANGTSNQISVTVFGSATPPSVSGCTDSDGGQNPNVAGLTDGRVNGLGSYFNDSSVASNGGQCSGTSCTSVAEGYCTSDGKVTNTLMSCSTGYSVNGACATKPGDTQSSAVISINPASPLTASVPAQNGGYLGLPVLVFDVSAQGDALHLVTIRANITSSGTGSVGAAYLYQGSTQVASAAVTNGIADFQIANGTAGATIPSGQSVPYTVKVDVAGVTSGQLVVSASVSGSAPTSIVDSHNIKLATLSGNASGNPITIAAAGPLFTLVGTPTITKTVPPQVSGIIASNRYDATFNVNVQAIGGDVVLGLPSSSQPAFGSNDVPTNLA